MTVRVLLADDHPLLLNGLATILEAADDLTVVGQASTGPDAVRLAEATRPDVVLMDIEMPDGDGIGATARILAALPRTRVLVLTTFDLDDYVLGALKAGASGFLLKATSPEDLTRAVRACAAGETQLAPSVARRLVESYVHTSPSRPADEVPERLRVLTAREVEVLRTLSRGLSNAEVAAALFLSEATVKTHVTRILTKLGVRDRMQAAVLAYESGLVRPGDGSVAGTSNP